MPTAATFGPRVVVGVAKQDIAPWIDVLDERSGRYIARTNRESNAHYHQSIPEPRRAVSLGMMMVVSTLQELVIDTPDADYWRGLLPRNDEALRLELTRALLSYLGVERPT
jgi:hypothetical protein